MTKPWNPKAELGSKAKPQWPEGATAGLFVIAVACVGVAALLYKVAGPRDVFTP